MSQQDFLSVFSDFIFQIQHSIGFDTKESKQLLPRIQQALSTVEMLHLPPHYQRSPQTTKLFRRRMDEIEATITEKIYQHGDARSRFQKYDNDATGFMNMSEFSQLLRSMEVYINDDELQYLVQKFGSANDNSINYSEFLQIGSSQKQRTEAETAYSAALFSIANTDYEAMGSVPLEDPHLKARKVAAMISAKLYQKTSSITDLFLHMDVEKDSHLNVDELLCGLQRLGIDIDRSSLQELTSAFVDEDGTLSIRNFARFLDSSSTYNFAELELCNNAEYSLAKDNQTQTSNDSYEKGFYDPLLEMSTASQLTNQSEEKIRELHISKPEDVNQPNAHVVHDIRQLIETTGSKLREVFDKLDISHTGSISRKDLRRGLAKMKINASQSECDRTLAEYDEDGEGSLKFHEFVKMVQSVPKQ